MTERTHYSRAPITEAIIDLRVAQPQEFTIENLALIQDAVVDRYPRQENMYTGQVNIQVWEPGQGEILHQQLGFRFIDKAEQHIFQARLDGFAFSVLAPYDRWETFRDEARHLWDVYRTATKAESITRVAVRYINRIDVPLATTPVVRIEDYLRTYPELPSDWPYQDLQSYFMQFQIPQEDLGCMLVINQATAPPPNAETTSILLDFDLFRTDYEKPWKADDDTAVWTFLERLHDRKNEYFEKSITDETRGLIR
jgi:uncharacterized protein (TIGR04255 family)